MNVPPYQWRAGVSYLPPMGDGFYPVPGIFVAPPGPVPVPFVVAPPPPYFVGGPPGFYAGPGPVPAPGPGAVPQPAAAATVAPPGNTIDGGLRPGVNILFGGKYTTLHVIRGCDEPWGAANPNVSFNIQKAPTDWSVGTLIDRLGGGEKITEVIEGGDGKWLKGLEIKKGSENAKKALEKVGWNEKRGGSRPPVWVVVTPEKK